MELSFWCSIVTKLIFIIRRLLFDETTLANQLTIQSGVQLLQSQQLPCAGAVREENIV